MAEFLITSKALWFALLCPFGAFLFWRETWKMLKAQGYEDSQHKWVSAEEKPLDFRLSTFDVWNNRYLNRFHGGDYLGCKRGDTAIVELILRSQ